MTPATGKETQQLRLIVPLKISLFFHTIEMEEMVHSTMKEHELNESKLSHFLLRILYFKKKANRL